LQPQRLTIYLYSAHRVVIFAIAQLSCLTCNSAKIQRQESRAVARKQRDIAGVWGLRFANIIHYKPK